MKKTLALSGMIIMGALGLACEPAANTNVNVNKMNSNMMNTNMMNSNMGSSSTMNSNHGFKFEWNRIQ